MSLTQENLRAFLERETVADFINLESYHKDEDGIGLYYCRNGYRGFAFELFPSSIAGLNEHESIVSALGYDFPEQTCIELFYIPSRNFDKILDAYVEGHSTPKNIKNPAAIKSFIEKNKEWLVDNRDQSIVQSPILDARPKNHRVFVTVMIPPIHNKTNNEIFDDEIIKYANITKGKLSTLSPIEPTVNDLLSVFNEAIAPAKKGQWNVEYDESTPIFNQFLSSEDELAIYEEDNSFIEHTSGGPSEKYYSAVLTTKKYPSRYNISKAQNLIFDMDGKNPKNHFASPFFISLKIVIENKEKLKKTQVSKSQVNRYQTNLLGERIKTYFPKLAEVSEESAELIQRLDSKGDIILKTQWSMVLHEKSINKMHERIETIKSEFEKETWILQQETEIPLMMFLYSLPFMFDVRYKNFSKRFATMLKSNNGAVVPLYRDSGSMGGPQKGMLLFGRQLQIQFFDNFEKGRPGNNIVIAAGTRSGKTFFISNKIAHDVACGRKSTFIELDETLHDFVESFGGRYIRFDDRNEKKCLNFFTNLKTLPNGELDPEALFYIVPLVGLMINWQLDGDETKVKDPNKAVMSSYVIKALKAAYNEAGNEAGMAHVHRHLELIYKELKESYGFDDARLRDAVTALEPYSQRGGAYYEFFNGKRNIYFTDSNLTAIGLAALKDKGDLFSIVLMALTQAIISEYFDKSKQLIEKLLYIDEAWALLENPIFVVFLIKVWRTLNKFNGAGVAISQDIDQYFKTPELEALYNNSTYKIFFKQPKDVIERMARDKKIPDDEGLKRSIGTLRTVTAVYSEMMVYTEEGFTINRVISNRYAFYLITNADNGPEVFALMQKINIKKHEAASILAFKDATNLSIQASLEKFQIDKGTLDIDHAGEEIRQWYQDRKAEVKKKANIEESPVKLTLKEKIKLLIGEIFA
ncbi:MAG: TraC family protein [Campylobacterales bacterium]|nr:TraC family protein [Campylobacterales bacterium]